MLVKFDPTIGTTNASLRAYNFMRVITAVATAAAGSTPVVRPMTAQNTFNNSLNCITEVLGNGEAGGWQVSGTNDTNGHNLPDATYTDANLQNRVYRADFWRASNKTVYPFVKFTITPSVQGTWTSNPFMDVICGVHTDSRFNAVAGYAPSGGDGGGTATSGRNITAPSSGLIGTGQIRPNETGNTGTGVTVSRSEFILAITQDYFILINPIYSITYIGLRTTNYWEDMYDDNPPLVAFHTPLTNWTDYRNVPRKMLAWWRLKDGLGQVRQVPFMSFYSVLTNSGTYGAGGDTFGVNGVIMGYQNMTYSTSEASSIARVSGDPFGGPIFRIKGMGGNYGYVTASGTYPWGQNWGTAYMYIYGPAQGTNYLPIVDPNTGIFVPPAYPMNMMLCITSTNITEVYFNQGGRLPGIYKSLSGSDEFMNRYYVPGQSFVVDNENYYPYVTGTDTNYRDMFLLRRY